MKAEELFRKVMEGIALLHKHRETPNTKVDMWFNFNGMEFLITMRRPSVADYTNLEKAKEKNGN
jgi:hypothetical protein